MPTRDISRSTAGLDREALATDLGGRGWHVVPGLLSAAGCAALRADYAADALYRSTISMQRHGFGRGEYRYYRYPLPDLVAALRTTFYPPLARIANDWAATLGRAVLYPADHATFLAQCALAGQSRPTPLILRYGPGDYNCLHQDLYGELHFPFQIAILLSRPGEDFSGGEFVLTEQRPRMQSRPHVVPLEQGDAVIFAVDEAPRQGSRGPYRVKLRHGVSEIRRGERFTLGVIFHDAG
ncbi:2OG-Fe(II) oxygenase [Sphingopyxis sp.]|uniref:2OG-Fe(II) oxygenase n=1 Tax=Sphingopyxis sp. TaxID=1908224 RepID=UPI0026167504|nr:2OG-Fe(II) oxygenase [Sphingopyxis sp.]MCW0199920.1 2OG-Fe(II) oxygenase [Sphingopyxis sp.]